MSSSSSISSSSSNPPKQNKKGNGEQQNQQHQQLLHQLQKQQQRVANPKTASGATMAQLPLFHTNTTAGNRQQQQNQFMETNLRQQPISSISEYYEQHKRQLELQRDINIRRRLMLEQQQQILSELDQQQQLQQKIHQARLNAASSPSIVGSRVLVGDRGILHNPHHWLTMSNEEKLEHYYRQQRAGLNTSQEYQRELLRQQQLKLSQNAATDTVVPYMYEVHRDKNNKLITSPKGISHKKTTVTANPRKSMLQQPKKKESYLHKKKESESLDDDILVLDKDSKRKKHTKAPTNFSLQSYNDSQTTQNLLHALSNTSTAHEDRKNTILKLQQLSSPDDHKKKATNLPKMDINDILSPNNEKKQEMDYNDELAAEEIIKESVIVIDDDCESAKQGKPKESLLSEEEIASLQLHLLKRPPKNMTDDLLIAQFYNNDKLNSNDKVIEDDDKASIEGLAEIITMLKRSTSPLDYESVVIEENDEDLIDMDLIDEIDQIEEEKQEIISDDVSSMKNIPNLPIEPCLGEASEALQKQENNSSNIIGVADKDKEENEINTASFPKEHLYPLQVDGPIILSKLDVTSPKNAAPHKISMDTWWPNNQIPKESTNYLHEIAQDQNGILEKIPHCILHHMRYKQQQTTNDILDPNNSTQKPYEPLYCWQVTELYPTDAMICCPKCYTWRHAFCAGHVDICDLCTIEQEFNKNLQKERKLLARRQLSTCNVMRHASFAKHGTYKWPLGSVSATHIGGHTRSVHARNERSEKQWSDMCAKLSHAPNNPILSSFNSRLKERVKLRAKELERLCVTVEDAELYTDRHNMLLFLQNDTNKLHPAGYETMRRNFFDPEDDCLIYKEEQIEDIDHESIISSSQSLDTVSTSSSNTLPTTPIIENAKENEDLVITSQDSYNAFLKKRKYDDDNKNETISLSSIDINHEDDSDSVISNSSVSDKISFMEQPVAKPNIKIQKCAKPNCTRMPRYDSLFCSDSCGVAALELDLIRSFEYANTIIHPSMLRPSSVANGDNHLSIL